MTPHAYYIETLKARLRFLLDQRWKWTGELTEAGERLLDRCIYSTERDIVQAEAMQEAAS